MQGRRTRAKWLVRQRPLTPVQVLALVVAAVMAIALCVVPLGVGYYASAYTPTESEVATGPDTKADHRVKVKHTKVGQGSTRRDPHAGESFSTTYEYDISRLPQEPGVDAQTTIYFNADYQAPFTDPYNLYFTSRPRGIRPESIKCNDQRTQCSATVDTSQINTGRNLSLTLTLRARVARDARPGSQIWGSGTVTTNYVPDIALQPGSGPYFVPDPGTPCVGTFRFQWRLGAGAWLADIKFADANGKGQLDINKEPLSASNPRSYIRVVDVRHRSNITRDVLTNMRYDPSDNTPPYQGDKDPVVASHPNAKWLQSANWPIDVSTYTGKTWIPAGSEVTVHKHGRHLGCVAGFATDWQTKRPFEASLSVARPQTSATAAGYTNFTLPGEPPKILTCQNKIWFAEEGLPSPGGRTDATLKYLGYIEGIDGATPTAYPVFRAQDGNGNPAEAGSIAVHQKHPERVYYLAYRRGGVDPIGLFYHDLNTGRYVPVDYPGVTAEDSLNISRNNRLNIGFDKDGLLWAVQEVRKPSLLVGGKSNLYALDVSSPSPRWRKAGSLEYDATRSRPHDIIFDNDGNAYLLSTGGLGQGLGKTGVLYRLDGRVLRRAFSGGKRAAFGALFGDSYEDRNFGRGGQFFGLAWGPDGGMYAAQTGVGMWKIDYGQWNSPSFLGNKIPASRTPALRYDHDYNSRFDAVDLGSCNYGERVQPSSVPKFRLQKSVIDPLTGAVVEPGKNSPHPAPLRTGSGIEADYYVTLVNFGSAPGDPGRVTDAITVPRGFTVSRVTVDGTEVRVGPDGSFTLPATGTMQANQARTWKIHLVSSYQDSAAVDWNQAQACGTDAAGAYGGGFLNKVSLATDSDGVENNHACISTEHRGSARITLIKDITDSDGRPLQARAKDARHFTLSAKRIGEDRAALLEGSSPSSGEVAVSRRVVVGRFQLQEHANDDGTHTGNYHSGSWKCTKDTGGRLPLDPANSIELKDGEDVTCRVFNYPHASLHLVKRARNAASASNPHIGAPVGPGRDGIYRMPYVVDVVNDSAQTVSAGKTTDKFTIPAGMRWAYGKGAIIRAVGPVPAGVSFDMDSASAPGCRYSPRANLPWMICGVRALTNGVTLANAIHGIPAHSKVSFEVTIPLVPDRTSAGPITSYEANAERLEKCVAATSASGRKYASPDAGVINTATLADEDQNYSDVASKDNRACVPVNVPLAPPPALPLTGGNSALAFYLFGLPALGLGLLGAVALRLRKAGAIGNSH